MLKNRQTFVLLGIREDKEGRRTHFVGVTGEIATAYDVTAENIHWRVNDQMDDAVVQVDTNDTGAGVTSTVKIEGPRKQLEMFLNNLGFATLTPKVVMEHPTPEAQETKG